MNYEVLQKMILEAKEGTRDRQPIYGSHPILYISPHNCHAIIPELQFGQQRLVRTQVQGSNIITEY